MKLTKANYFTSKNKYLSNSKINDWLKDKEYFYKRHISNEIDKEETPSLRLGKAVDYYVFDGPAKFAKKYKMVARRSKEPEKRIIELPTAEYQEVIEMGQKINRQDAMKEVKKWYKTQVILQNDLDLGHFTGICGILDALYIDKNKEKAIIMDLKTSKEILPKKYFWHCIKYNYIRQLAMYSILVEKNYGITDIEYQHLVMEKDPDGIYNCQTFVFEKDLIKKEVENIWKLLEEIKRETKFLPRNVGWKDAVMIGKAREYESEGVEI